jgi:hypothetical protein
MENLSRLDNSGLGRPIKFLSLGFVLNLLLVFYLSVKTVYIHASANNVEPVLSHLVSHCTKLAFILPYCPNRNSGLRSFLPPVFSILVEAWWKPHYLSHLIHTRIFIEGFYRDVIPRQMQVECYIVVDLLNATVVSNDIVHCVFIDFQPVHVDAIHVVEINGLSGEIIADEVKVFFECVSRAKFYYVGVFNEGFEWIIGLSMIGAGCFTLLAW